MVIGGGGVSRRSSRGATAVSVESRMRSGEQVKRGGGVKVGNGGSGDGACKSESNSPLQKRKSFCNVNGICRSPVGSKRERLVKAVVVVEDCDRKSAIVVSDSRSDRRSEKEEVSLEVDGSDRNVSGVAKLDTAKPRSDEEEGGDHDESGDDDGSGGSGEDDEGEVEEMIDEEIEVEKNISCDIDEVVVEESVDSDCDDKEMINVMQVNNPISDLEPKQSLAMLTIEKSSAAMEISSVKKQSPKFTAPVNPSPIRDSYENQRVPEAHSKLQSLVDLLMWKYVPRSTFVFGVGTFLIISSSYTTDLNFSFISVVSYLGLVYLGISFLYRSFINRSAVDGNDTSYCHGMVMIGEEDAIWLARLILPCLNEFLLKLKALFTGDPVVTMKLAAVLFALARCGSCITVWKTVKLGFFVAFILPKFFSSYSAQIGGYGKFWFLRFQDAWRSCSHKKVVGFAMFTIVWNLSSVVARIWAAFMLFVAVRYYQQSALKVEECVVVEVEVEAGRTSMNNNHALQKRPLVMKQMRQGRPSSRLIPSTPVHLRAAKKAL